MVALTRKAMQLKNRYVGEDLSSALEEGLESGRFETEGESTEIQVAMSVTTYPRFQRVLESGRIECVCITTESFS